MSVWAYIFITGSHHTMHLAVFVLEPHWQHIMPFQRCEKGHCPSVWALSLVCVQVNMHALRASIIIFCYCETMLNNDLCYTDKPSLNYINLRSRKKRKRNGPDRHSIRNANVLLARQFDL